MFAVLTIPGADAAAVNKLTLSDGTEISYALALPANFSAERIYPVLIALPGGRQNLDSVRGGLARYWETEALRRGYIVISPAAPQGRPFFKTGIDLIPEFLSRLQKIYRVKNDKFHLAGHSNGAVSAFRAAIRTPKLFQSLTAIAGYPEAKVDFSRLNRLHSIAISMFVGDGDLYWKEGMERTVRRLSEIGNNAHFEIIARNGHFLPDLSFENSTKIFNHIRP
jgi:predicted esterase